MSTTTTTVKDPGDKPAAKNLRKVALSEEAMHAGHLMLLHKLASLRGLQLKLAAYFAGMTAQCMADAHGVSQGKKGSQGEGWESYLKRTTGIPYRTVARYRTAYQQIITAHPEIAKKLNAQWEKLTSANTLTNGEAAESALAAVDLPAKALQAIAEEPDEWKLHELFAKEDEAEDVTEEGEDSGGAREKRAALIKFWSLSVTRRMKTDEFLRLPKTQLEAFAATAEEAAKKARAALEKKKPAKK